MPNYTWKIRGVSVSVTSILPVGKSFCNTKVLAKQSVSSVGVPYYTDQEYSHY